MSHPLAAALSVAVNLVLLGLFIACGWSGLKNYLAIARAAGVAPFGFTNPWRVYRYAFGPMRGSRETRRMLLGFAGMFFVLPVPYFLLEIALSARAH